METTSWESCLVCDSRASATMAYISGMKCQTIHDEAKLTHFHATQENQSLIFFKECLTFRRAARGISLNVSTLYSCESKKRRCLFRTY